MCDFRKLGYKSHKEYEEAITTFGVSLGYQSIRKIIDEIMKDCPVFEEEDPSFKAGYFTGFRAMTDRLKYLLTLSE